jgi:hypothetical protein
MGKQRELAVDAQAPSNGSVAAQRRTGSITRMLELVKAAMVDPPPVPAR